MEARHNKSKCWLTGRSKHESSRRSFVQNEQPMVMRPLLGVGDGGNESVHVAQEISVDQTKAEKKSVLSKSESGE